MRLLARMCFLFVFCLSSDARVKYGGKSYCSYLPKAEAARVREAAAEVMAWYSCRAGSTALSFEDQWIEATVLNTVFTSLNCRIVARCWRTLFLWPCAHRHVTTGFCPRVGWSVAEQDAVFAVQRLCLLESLSGSRSLLTRSTSNPDNDHSSGVHANANALARGPKLVPPRPRGPNYCQLLTVAERREDYDGRRYRICREAKKYLGQCTY